MINPPPNQIAVTNKDGVVDAAWKAYFSDVYVGVLATQQSGTTANRPTKNLYAGRPYFDTTLNQECIYTGTTWLALAGGGGGGETNTASNVGAGGVGLYKSKTGVNLDFRNINAGSSKVSVTLDAVNNEVDIDVVTANFTGIPESAVTNLVSDLAAKKTDSMSTNKLLGRGAALTGVIEEITLGTNLSLSGTTLNATGGGSVTINTATVTVPYGTNAYIATITDANVLVTSNLIVSLGVYADTDENDPDDDLNAAFYVEQVLAGSFKLSIESRDQSTIGGVFKFNYLIG